MNTKYLKDLSTLKYIEEITKSIINNYQL